MAALLILVTIAVVAIVAALVAASRDGYGQVASHPRETNDVWPSASRTAPTRLA
jgi:hypothetical protein